MHPLIVQIAVLAAAATPESARQGGNEQAQNPSANVRLLGLHQDGSPVVGACTRDRRCTIEAQIRNGPRKILSRAQRGPPGWLTAEAQRLRLGALPVPVSGPPWSFGFDRLWVENSPALGGRRKILIWFRTKNGADIVVDELSYSHGGRVGPARLLGSSVLLDTKHRQRAGVMSIDLGPARGASLSKRAIDALRARKLTLAETLFAEAIEADPQSGSARYNLACAQALGGDLERAAANLATAFELDGARLRRIARFDPDLDALRTRIDLAEPLEIEEE